MRAMIRDDKMALDRAKAAAGGPVELARKLGGISSQAVSQWRRVPAERVIEVERVSGISREELRPDLYPSASPALSPSPLPQQERVGS